MALVVVHESVLEEPFWMADGFATRVQVGAAGGGGGGGVDVTVTAAEQVTVPPGPVAVPV